MKKIAPKKKIKLNSDGNPTRVLSPVEQNSLNLETVSHRVEDALNTLAQDVKGIDEYIGILVEVLADLGVGGDTSIKDRIIQKIRNNKIVELRSQAGKMKEAIDKALEAGEIVSVPKLENDHCFVEFTQTTSEGISLEPGVVVTAFSTLKADIQSLLIGTDVGASKLLENGDSLNLLGVYVNKVEPVEGTEGVN